MNDKKPLNILWLSDIHFSDTGNYLTDGDSSRGEIDNILAGLSAKVAVYKEHKGIDYVIISGDLVMKGLSTEYANLDKMLIARLKELLPGIPIFTIPGNHDVKWDNVDFIGQEYTLANNYLLKRDSRNLSELRNNEFADSSNFENFENLFREYSNYSAKLNETNPQLLSTEKNKNYSKERLCGYIVDESNEILFIFLNTSWFAIGEYFNKKFAEVFLQKNFLHLKSNILLLPEKTNPADLLTNEYGKAIASNIFEKILALKDFFSEYGQQIIGTKYLEEKSALSQAMQQYAGYTVITCMHHPLNWLQYGEKYNIQGNKNGEDALLLNKILEASSIVLTGHEHVPDSIGHETTSDGTIIFKAGMFLQDNFSPARRNEGQNRFSILEIEQKHKTVKEIKYVFDWSNNIWEESLLNKEDPIILKHKKKVLTPQQLTELKHIDTLKKFNVKECLCHDRFNMPVFREAYTTIEPVPTAPANDLYLLFKCTPKKAGETGDRIIILPLSHAFYTRITQPHKDAANASPHLFCEIFEQLSYAPTVTTLTILSVDLLISEQKAEKYTNKSEDYELVFSELCKTGDEKFDIARHHFFTEATARVPEKSEAKAWFSRLFNLNLTHVIIPYWVYNKFLGNP